jgi:hypothetical protein
MNAQVSIKDMIAEFSTSLTSIRDRIGNLNARARAIAKAPVTVETALARVDEQIAQQKARLAERMPLPDYFCRPDRGGPDSLDIGIILAFQQIDKAGEFLKGQVHVHLQGAETMDQTDREAKLAKIGRERLDLELSEEAIIRQAEAIGLDIGRRSDADVRAVLAHDSALPA